MTAVDVGETSGENASGTRLYSSENSQQSRENDSYNPREREKAREKREGEREKGREEREGGRERKKEERERKKEREKSVHKQEPIPPWQQRADKHARFPSTRVFDKKLDANEEAVRDQAKS